MKRTSDEPGREPGIGQAPPRPRVKWRPKEFTTVIGLIAVVALAIAVRIPGLSGSGLWRDDAWTALASKVGLGTALRMSTTTPGFTLAERTWIGFDPGSSLWAQQFPLLIGIAGVVAIFLLVRYWGLSRWLALTAAFVVAVSPIAAQYSTHTKEYSTDFLLTCLVLWRAEAARRSPTTRLLAILAVVSAAALFVSASVTPVVVGAWGAVLVCNLRVADGRWRIVSFGATVVVFLGGLYFLLFRHLPLVLHQYWADSDAFLSRSSIGAFWHSLGFAVSVVTVGLVAPAGHFDIYGDPSWSAGHVLWPAVGLVAVLLVGLTARGRAAAAGLTLLVAVVASFVGTIPLGTGRTDEALYPAVLVLAVLGVDQIVKFGARRLAPWPTAPLLGTVVVVAAIGTFALVSLNSGTVRHPPRYPEVNVRQLAALVDQHKTPGDWVLVDPYTRYPWALYAAKNPQIEFGRGWGAGFTVVSTQPEVFISPTETWEDPYQPAVWAGHVADAGRLWYVGTWFLTRQEDPVYQALLAQGWKPQQEFDVTGGFAVLMTGGGTPAPTLLQEGVAAIKAGQTSTAISRFQAVMAKDPSDVDAPYNLGVISQTRGNAATAENYYKRALALDSDYKPALYNLAIVETTGDPTQAIAAYTQLLELNPNDPNVLWNLGLLLIAQNQSAQGHSDLEKAIFINPAFKSRTPAGITP